MIAYTLLSLFCSNCNVKLKSLVILSDVLFQCFAGVGGMGRNSKKTQRSKSFLSTKVFQSIKYRHINISTAASITPPPSPMGISRSVLSLYTPHAI